MAGANVLKTFQFQSTLKSFRLTNVGITTATITLSVVSGGSYYPLTPLAMRLEASETAIDEEANMTIYPNDALMLASDSMDVMWWIEV